MRAWKPRALQLARSQPAAALLGLAIAHAVIELKLGALDCAPAQRLNREIENASIPRFAFVL